MIKNQIVTEIIWHSFLFIQTKSGFRAMFTPPQFGGKQHQKGQPTATEKKAKTRVLRALTTQ